MKQFKYLQPLDQMTQISRTEVGTRLDEILEIVDKENVGYIITDEGKDDLVLCPARWMEWFYDDDLGYIMSGAIRHTIGGYNDICSIVVDFVRRHIDVLDIKTTLIMIEDIERATTCETLEQRSDWLRLRDDLKKYYEILSKQTASESGTTEAELSVGETLIKIKIDADLYEKTDAVFRRYGLTHEQAIRLFIKETVRLGKIPFEYTQEDVREAKRLCHKEDGGR